MLQKTIPIIRIFDEALAKDYYLNWLGFSLNWEHRFEENAPLYCSIQKDAAEFHLSEHFGDGVPGIRLFIECTQLEQWCRALNEKKYRYYRPAVEKTFYNSLCMTLKDPFGNTLLFNQALPETP